MAVCVWARAVPKSPRKNESLAGDEHAFRQLVDRHHRRVYRFLLKHAISAAEAEELTQHVFLQAYLGLAEFRGESRCSSWLIGIALNLVRNYTNRSPWRLLETGIDALSHEIDCDVPDPSRNPESVVAHFQALDELAAALGKLSAEARESLMLVGMEGMSYEEAAALLGVPPGVKSRVSRARKQLIELIGSSHLETLRNVVSV